ncbi:MAG: LTA synthase family protein [Veillonellaceae bacterium]|nr:LTA synthase family protein [Veillonellaceae bacterium]
MNIRTLRQSYPRLTLYIACLAAFMLVQTVLRTALIVSSWTAVNTDISGLIKPMIAGVLFDLAAGTAFCLPLGLLLIILPYKLLSGRIGRSILMIGGTVFNFIMWFSAIALYLFWQEFHANFNFIAVDYLVYTHEMLKNIQQSYPVGIIIPILVLLSAMLTYAELRMMPRDIPRLAWPRRILAAAICAAIPVLLVASSHGSLRQHISQNKYLQEAAGNGMYCFVEAYFANELNYHQFYATRSDDATLKAVRRMLAAPNVVFTDDNSIRRKITNNNQLTGKKPNIIIITEESLSASYSKSFGGPRDWTPRLDSLAEKSYVFSRMYATGTRTVRGLEAISLSLPPTPGQSILRRDGNENMSTLGDALHQNGYHADFVYGGYGYFDNMNAFFSGNGYAIHDRKDIPDSSVQCETAWGADDGALFDHVITLMDEHESDGVPALEMVMTTSNHRPYKYPATDDDMKALEGVREGACRYADQALGEFIEKARGHAWFDNTVFVIIADHQADVAGRTSLPVDRYHIPCVIYAPSLLKPGTSDRLISQIDLAPTLLGMLGISYESNFMGRDIAMVPKGQEHVFISTYQSLGYIKNDKLIVLKPGQQSESLTIDDWATSKYEQSPEDADTLDEAIAWYQTAGDLFHAGKLHQCASAKIE